MTETAERTSRVKPTSTIYDDFLNCFLKLECNNPSGSHKDRETLYLVNKFGWDKSYIVISSGNAGISLAYWMKEKATVLVPEITPREKIDAIEKYGADVIVKGEYYYDSYKLVERIARQKKLINISPGFADRWMGDESISYELRPLHLDYVFIPSANHTLAYGVACGFNEMFNERSVAKLPMIVSCVVPNHPFVNLAEKIEDRFKQSFSSIYTHGGEGENLERRFLRFSFTKAESTHELESVLRLGEKYPKYDPAVLLAMEISKNFSGKKVIVVTGIKRSAY
jgi:threonine synthase